jgi:hypothetical protein
MTPIFLVHTLQTRRSFFVAYVALTGLLNLLWEIVQLPLYTLWDNSTPSSIAFAVVHCTLGDILIGLFSLTAALILAGPKDWPLKRYWMIALITGSFGLAYTVLSEWMNTVVVRSWEYSTLMPTLWGIGLSPLAQWCAIPGFIFWYLRREKELEPGTFL